MSEQSLYCSNPSFEETNLKNIFIGKKQPGSFLWHILSSYSIDKLFNLKNLH